MKSLKRYVVVVMIEKKNHIGLKYDILSKITQIFSIQLSKLIISKKKTKNGITQLYAKVE